MEQEKPLFKGSVDGVQFDDYKAFTKFLHEHPESTKIEFSLDSSAAKPVFKFPTTCHVTEKGQTLNPDELIYPLLETPDHYLATHDQDKWFSDLEKVTTYADSFISKHERDIKNLSDKELSRHNITLAKCYADVTEALKFNEKADKKVCDSTTEYSAELDGLNACIKKCKQRINVIRKEEIPALEDKKQALTVTDKLLKIYEEMYAILQDQVAKEYNQRKNDNTHQLKSSQLKSSQDNQSNESGMVRLINAIFGL